MADLFGKRENEIIQAKKSGKKVIGYLCLFAPIELILAADAIPVRINSGWYDAAKLGDRIMPVEICPVIRSTVGAKMESLSPYLELSDAVVIPLTCDGRTKLSEILADYKPIWHMNPPRVKDDPHTLNMWKQEIQVIKEKIEKLTGNKITRKNLKKAFDNFFENIKKRKEGGTTRRVGYPRFKSRKSRQSYSTCITNDNIKIDWNKKVLKLPTFLPLHE